MANESEDEIRMLRRIEWLRLDRLRMTSLSEKLEAKIEQLKQAQDDLKAEIEILRRQR